MCAPLLCVSVTSFISLSTAVLLRVGSFFFSYVVDVLLLISRYLSLFVRFGTGSPKSRAQVANMRVGPT